MKHSIDTQVLQKVVDYLNRPNADAANLIQEIVASAKALPETSPETTETTTNQG